MDTQLSDKITFIAQYHEYSPSTTNFAYTGAYITIPAHTIFSITVVAWYAYSIVNIIGLSLSSTNFAPNFLTSNVTGETHASTTFSYFTEDSSSTIYVWTKCNTTTTEKNTITFRGWYLSYT